MFSILFPMFSRMAAGNIKSIVKKTREQIIGTVLLAVALFFAAIFVCMTLFFLLANFMAPVKAAAVLALVWLLVAFVGLICLKISLHKQKKAREAIVNDEQKDLIKNTAMAALPGILAMGMKSYKRVGLLAVLAVGAYVAYNAVNQNTTDEDDAAN